MMYSYRRSVFAPVRLAAITVLAIFSLMPFLESANAQVVCEINPTIYGGGTASGLSSFACGSGASTAGFNNATAVGFNVDAANEAATAVGHLSRATGQTSTAMGAQAWATGNASTVMGFGTQGSGYGTTAVGFIAQARGEHSTAIGSGTLASGYASTATGISAHATGDQSTAIGYLASAGGTDTSAFGSFSTANFSNSTAIGANTATTRANQMMHGSATNTHTMPGLNSAASKSAQGTPTYIVTANANGDLASYTLPELGIAAAGYDLSNFATKADLSNFATKGDLSNFATKGDLAALQSEINNLARRDDKLAEGIATVAALAQPILVPGQHFAMRAGWGGFDSANAVGLSAAGVIGKNILRPGSGTLLLDGGVGFGTEEGEVTGRAGMSFGW